jgi:hypothetical protein
MMAERASGIAAALGAGAILLWLVHFALGGSASWLKYVWTAALAVGVVFYVTALIAKRR